MNFIFPPGFDFLDLTWRAYTPTVTPQSGAYVNVTVTGRWAALGKTVFGKVEVNMVDRGTGSGVMNIATPAFINENSWAMGGENGSYRLVSGQLAAGASLLKCLFADGTDLHANGRYFIIPFRYERN